MPTSSPTEILLQHDRWATRQIIDACTPLTPEQFHEPFQMGPGSLHNTIEHILGAMRRWNDTLAQREPRPKLEVPNSRRTIPELIALHNDLASELAALMHSHPLEEIVTRNLNGQDVQFTRGAVLTHITTHGMHHRAQCLNMLRHLGVSPLLASSVMTWARTVDAIP